MKTLVRASFFVLSILGLIWLANTLVDSWYPFASEIQQTSPVFAYNEQQQPVPTSSMIRLRVKFFETRAIQGNRMNMTLNWVGDRDLRLVAIEILDEGAANRTRFSRVLDPPTQLEQYGRIDLIWSIGQPAKRTIKMTAYFDDADPRYSSWRERALTEGVGSYAINGTRYPTYIASASFTYVSIDQLASERIWLDRVLVSTLFAAFPFLVLSQLGGLRSGESGEKKSIVPRSNDNPANVQRPPLQNESAAHVQPSMGKGANIRWPKAR